MSAAAKDPIDVTDNRQLAEYGRRWRDCPLLALDTEFVRETTFYPIPGLVQIGDGEREYLVDPLSVDDWSPLRELFAAPVAKVLHSCGEDLELCNRLLDAVPTPLFDTQIGAALAGLGFSLSYQALVQTCLGIAVEKEHTRSDWVARPLSAAQRHYAALDVAYLPELYRQLAERLSALGRFEWWREEGERLAAASREPADPQAYYLKLGAGWRLRGAQLVALQRLCVWREAEARGRNVPRGRILKDAQCIELARCLPRNAAALAAVPELAPQQVRREGNTLLAIVEAARDTPPELWPRPVPAPLPRERAGSLQRLRQLAAARAAELNVPAELLARKRDCESVLRSGELPEGLTGWRRAVIGDDLVALAREMGAPLGDEPEMKA